MHRLIELLRMQSSLLKHTPLCIGRFGGLLILGARATPSRGHPGHLRKRPSWLRQLDAPLHEVRRAHLNDLNIADAYLNENCVTVLGSRLRAGLEPAELLTKKLVKIVVL